MLSYRRYESESVALAVPVNCQSVCVRRWSQERDGAILSKSYFDFVRSDLLVGIINIVIIQLTTPFYERIEKDKVQFKTP